MGEGEAFAIQALAEVSLNEQAARRRHRRMAGEVIEYEPRRLAALAAIIIGLGERIAAFGRRLDVPAAEPAIDPPGGIVHPA